MISTTIIIGAIVICFVFLVIFTIAKSGLVSNFIKEVNKIKSLTKKPKEEDEEQWRKY